jgi:aldose 1-epimerase
MPFQFAIKKVQNFDVIQLMDTELNVFVEIVSKGALLNSWQWNQLENTYHFIEGNSIQSALDFEKNGFRSAKMSPYVCRLHQGQYVHENTPYTMDHFYMGEHAIHGIMYDANFTIQATEANENNATVVLSSHYLGTDKGYPFNFTMEIKWTLEKNNKLTVQTNVTNNAATNIPIVDGWHPYFTIGESINDCTLQFLSKGKMEYDNNLLPTGNIIKDETFTKGFTIGQLQLDDGYELNETNPTCTLQNDKFILTIYPSKGYPYLQLYTPPDRKSIAIENLSGAPNAFNNKIGLQILKPQGKSIFETSYQITIKQ